MANKRLDYQKEKKRLAERLKQYHDWKFTPGVYEHSIFGMAAKLLEVDAVEVVRCKECKHRGDPILCRMIVFDSKTHQLSDWTRDNGFCDFGMRREPDGE